MEIAGISLLVYIAIVLVVILFSMTIHEAMHGFMAYWLGDDTAKMQGRLTLNPVKHIDPFLTILLPIFLAIIGGPIFGGAKPVPFNPARLRYDEWGAALVALAGPLTNLVFSFLFFAVYFFVGLPAPSSSLFAQFLYLGVIVNLGFFMFNMIPFPPLDGSRVLYAIAPDFVRQAMSVIEQFGIIFVFLIIFVASAQIGQFIGGSIDFFLGAFESIFTIFG